MQLEGKIGLVTGSSRGIGRATAIELARRGADVVVNCAQSVSDAEKVAAEIRSMGRRSVVVQADVSREAECIDMVDRSFQSSERSISS